MDGRELEVRVRERAGMRTLEEARRSLAAALGALRCALADDDVRALVGALPVEPAAMRRPASTHVETLEELYAEAQRRERVERAFAMEHVQVVLEVLAEQLDPEIVARLRHHLPDDVAALLRPAKHPAEAPPHVHRHPDRTPAPRQTLSRARPGSADPIADAQHGTGQSGSVAREGAQHTDRMIATASSTRPRTEDETLSTARGPREPK